MMMLFFHVPAATVTYTLSLHDALPICRGRRHVGRVPVPEPRPRAGAVRAGLRTRARTVQPLQSGDAALGDRKSTRLNSSHTVISYAVICLKKKNEAGYDR